MYLAITAAPADPQTAVVVRLTRPDSVELAVDVLHDHQFGPVVTLGFASPLTDLLGDRAVRLLPVTGLDAARMSRSLRGAPLLTGDHGAQAVDVATLEDLLLRVGRLAEDLPEVAPAESRPGIGAPTRT